MDFEKHDPDRRSASAVDIGRLVEQNQGIANTVQSMGSIIAAYGTRIAVLEVKADLTQKDIGDMKENASETLRVLAEHTQQEDKDRQRLLIAVIATLISVIGGIAAIYLQRMP